MSDNNAADKLFDYEELVVAIDLPSSACNELAQAALALKKTCSPLHMHIFWIPANIVHISMLYTARLRTDLREAFIEAVQEVARETGPFTVALKGVQLYEEAGSEGAAVVKALWAGVEDDGALGALRTRLQEALGDWDLQLDDLEFRPHAVLALVDQFRNTREFNSAFVEWQDKLFGEVRIDSLAVKVAQPRSGSIDGPFEVVGTALLEGLLVEEVEE